MADLEPYVRPLSDASSGDAPGRGRLVGRRILVVGGGQRVVDPETDPIGNGRAMAMLFAREGATVAVADRDERSAQATVQLITDEAGSAVGSAFAVVADIAVESDVARMLREAHTRMGGIDGLVLNVGIGEGVIGLAAVTVDDWDRTFAVNVRGPMLCCRDGLGMLDDGSPIVLVSSIAALKAGSQLAAYDASKAALGGLMRNVALEGSRRGIRVNTVVPGLVDTPLGRATTLARPSRARARVPFGRQATGWEIAHAALFFVSDESVYVTAQMLAVDSGLSGL